jgi:shikimate dehydrogenase
MHEAGYRALGLPFTYVPFEVRDLAGAIAGMRALGIRGFGVSHPFKQDVIPLLDALDPVAARIGAVNTIVNTDGRLVGHNTDWIGATRALEEERPLAGARVLLLGAGGAARAIAFGLREAQAQTTIANRDMAKARALAKDVHGSGGGEGDVEVVPWEARAPRAAASDVIVNATSLGQRDVAPEESPLPGDAFPPGWSGVVMDIVYKPVHTPLLAAARARASGARVVHGGRMLLHQATAQFHLYTGEKAPLEAMTAALRQGIGDEAPPVR